MCMFPATMCFLVVFVVNFSVTLACNCTPKSKNHCHHPLSENRTAFGIIFSWLEKFLWFSWSFGKIPKVCSEGNIPPEAKIFRRRRKQFDIFCFKMLDFVKKMLKIVYVKCAKFSPAVRKNHRNFYQFWKTITRVRYRFTPPPLPFYPPYFPLFGAFLPPLLFYPLISPWFAIRGG